MYKLAINRPITTLMFVLSLIVFGLMSFNKMPAALYPNIDFPLITIQTVYSGADPKTIESKITDPIEEAVSAIGGIDMINSTSSEGMSVVIVKFLLSRDINEAANDVRDKVAAIQLPEGADKPLVSKLDIGGASVINLFVSSEKVAAKEMMLFVDQKVKPRLQKISGVGSVNIIGYREREIKIYPDPFMLNKYGITIAELNSIIARENVKKGGGRFISKVQELIIKTEADAKSTEQLGNIKIKEGVRLKDIARIEDGLEDARSYASFNSKPGVMLEIKKISGTNTLTLIDNVKTVVPQLKEIAGDAYGITLLNDTSTFILHSLHDVKFDLIYGAFLAVLIVFLFLRNTTATLVSALSIPTSIIGTFALMEYMGYELNKMTLIGLTLAIGILIDDAIVVIENIYKKLEKGMGRFEAAYEGVKEVAFSILAISAMLLAVFVPVAFMSGIVGKFFNSFAITVAFAVIISYIIALTLIPSLSARVLNEKQSRFYVMTEPILAWIDRVYVKLLKIVLRFKWLTLIGIFALLFGSFSLGGHVGVEFIPKEDKSEFEIKIKAPSGISLEEMTRQLQTLQERVKADDDVKYTTLSIGYNTAQEINKAIIYVKLVAIENRKSSQQDIVQNYREKLRDTKNLFITVADIPAIKGAGVSVPYQLVLKSDSLESLAIAADNIKGLLSEKEGVVDIDSNYEAGKPELRIGVKRQNAARFGISALEIVSIINTAFSSDRSISQYEEFGKQFDITLRFDDDFRRQISDLKRMQITAPDGRKVYLEGIVTFEEGLGAASIFHMDRERQTTIFADLYGTVLGDAVSYTEEHIKEMLPKDVEYRFTGFAEEMEKTGKAFMFAVLLTVVMMYLILAALYESLLQPLIIMVALPLSLIGVLTALFLTAKTFNLFTMIGFMLLMGMVGKNAVLLVDFANQAIKRGLSTDDAILEAGEKRLRPILMTTFAMIFAMLPLAMGTGIGSETKSPMATAIIGGLISSMVLTLLVVPAMYKIMNPIDQWMRKWYEKRID
ncbi:MAG: efflux RND transporter permease subunit [Campylobacterota bacterium]|nr:efflux RND transporter permease subunit [Campylobacterota bacterium]